MSRCFAVAVSSSLMLLASGSPVAALDLDILGPTSAVVAPGETVTIDLRMANPDQSSIYGLGASAHGYDEGFEFVSGTAVGQLLTAVCIAPGICLGGLTNLAGDGPFAGPKTLEESEIGSFGRRVQMALAASTSPVANSGALDQGFDGEFGTAMFRVTFRALVPGAYDLSFDSSYQGDGVNLPNGVLGEIDGSTFSVIVTPEPGSAILLFLGLASLGALRKR